MHCHYYFVLLEVGWYSLPRNFVGLEAERGNEAALAAENLNAAA